jgi:hypothetical protein
MDTPLPLWQSVYCPASSVIEQKDVAEVVEQLKSQQPGLTHWLHFSYNPCEILYVCALYTPEHEQAIEPQFREPQKDTQHFVSCDLKHLKFDYVYLMTPESIFKYVMKSKYPGVEVQDGQTQPCQLSLAEYQQEQEKLYEWCVTLPSISAIDKLRFWQPNTVVAITNSYQFPADQYCCVERARKKALSVCENDIKTLLQQHPECKFWFFTTVPGGGCQGAWDDTFHLYLLSPSGVHHYQCVHCSCYEYDSDMFLSTYKYFTPALYQEEIKYMREIHKVQLPMFF